MPDTLQLCLSMLSLAVESKHGVKEHTCGNNDSTAGLQPTVSALDVHELL